MADWELGKLHQTELVAVVRQDILGGLGHDADNGVRFRCGWWLKLVFFCSGRMGLRSALRRERWIREQEIAYDAMLEKKN